MQDRADKAEAYFKQGYNCAQAVALAFADKMGMEPALLSNIAQPFGGGMGKLREVCGAVSGMLMVLGLRQEGDGLDKQKRAQVYARVQQAAEEFRAQTGSIICGELLELPGPQDPVPEERTESYYERRPCAEYVRIAARIACGFFGED